MTLTDDVIAVILQQLTTALRLRGRVNKRLKEVIEMPWLPIPRRSVTGNSSRESVFTFAGIAELPISNVQPTYLSKKIFYIRLSCCSSRHSSRNVPYKAQFLSGDVSWRQNESWGAAWQWIVEYVSDRVGNHLSHQRIVNCSRGVGLGRWTRQVSLSREIFYKNVITILQTLAN